MAPGARQKSNHLCPNPMLRVVSSRPARPQAPARKLGSMARACLADGSKNVGLYNAAKHTPKNSERDAHRLFAKYWLSLKVPISFMKVPPEDDGIFSSIPFYKARWFVGANLRKHKLEPQNCGKPVVHALQVSIWVRLLITSKKSKCCHKDFFQSGYNYSRHTSRTSRAPPTEAIFGSK